LELFEVQKYETASLGYSRAIQEVGCEKLFGLERFEIQQYEKESLGYSRAI